jgi:hypothetical protein
MARWLSTEGHCLYCLPNLFTISPDMQLTTFCISYCLQASVQEHQKITRAFNLAKLQLQDAQRQLASQSKMLELLQADLSNSAHANESLEAKLACSTRDLAGLWEKTHSLVEERYELEVMVNEAAAEQAKLRQHLDQAEADLVHMMEKGKVETALLEEKLENVLAELNEVRTESDQVWAMWGEESEMRVAAEVVAKELYQQVLGVKITDKELETKEQRLVKSPAFWSRQADADELLLPTLKDPHQQPQPQRPTAPPPPPVASPVALPNVRCSSQSVRYSSQDCRFNGYGPSTPPAAVPAARVTSYSQQDARCTASPPLSTATPTPYASPRRRASSSNGSSQGDARCDGNWPPGAFRCHPR